MMKFVMKFAKFFVLFNLGFFALVMITGRELRFDWFFNLIIPIICALTEYMVEKQKKGKRQTGRTTV